MSSRMKYVIPLLFLCSVFLYGQSQEAEAEKHGLEIGLSLSYYHPNLDNLNDAFYKLELDNSLMHWNKTNINYLLLPTAIYRLDRKQSVVLQLGGSYIQSDQGSAKNYYYIWMIGGEYRYMTWSWKKYNADLCVAAGGGIIGSKFYRSYPNDVALKVSSSTIYIDAGATFSIGIMQGLSAKADLRYLFSPTKSLDNPKCDLSLKSVTAGIGVFYSL